MNTVLMWIGGLLVALLAALFAVPHFIDWNGYRGVVEEEATRLLGRDVRVGGAVNVRLLPAPYLRFEKLRIADTSGIAGAPLFATEGFTLWLAVSPLLRGEFVAQRIELDRPTLTLAADKAGVVNWRSLSLNEGVLPFLPASVALNSVGIKGGVVSAHLEGGGEIARVSDIDGEFVASSITGPFSFRGTAGWEGSPREVRIATTEADAEGRMRLTAQVRGRRGKDTHTLDGQIRNAFEKPLFEGTLDSRLVLDTIAAEATAEIKAAVSASPGELKLADIAISFESLGQPQLITGSLAADWGHRHKLTVALASRWLDLDRLSGGLAQEAGTAGSNEKRAAAQPSDPTATLPAPAPKQPLRTARRLIAGLTGILPVDADVASSLRIDQVSLGGEPVGSVLVVIERNGGPLQMRSLRAVLPGGARLDFSGELVKEPQGQVFAGSLYIGGASAARAIRWLRGPGAQLVDISDGPFAISSGLRLGADVIQLTDMMAEFSGVPIRGAVDWQDGADRKLDITLAGHEFDTRWLGLGGIEFSSLADLLSPADGTARPAWMTTDSAPIRVDLALGKLVSGDLAVLDLDTKGSVSAGMIDLERLQFKTREGVRVEADGRFDGLSARPAGSLRFLVEGETAGAATALAVLIGGEASGQAAGPRLAGLAPYRLAGTLAIGAEGRTAADVDLAGSVRGSPLSARVRLANGLTGWREAPADISVHIGDGGGASLLAGWLGMGAVSAGAGGRPGDTAGPLVAGAGSGMLKAVGIPGKGLLTLVEVEAGPRSVVFNGTTAVSAQSWDVMSGELAIARADLGSVLTSVGIDPGAGLSAVALDGLVDVARGDRGYVLSPRDLTVGGSTVAGRIEVDTADGGRRLLKARLSADKTALDGLLAAVLVADRGAGQGGADPAARDPGLGDPGSPAGQPIEPAASAPFLPDRPFDLSAGERFGLDAEVRLGRLDVGGGLGLEDVSLKIMLDQGGVTAEIADSRALAGSVTGLLRLKRAAAGVEAEGRLQIAKADLARLSALAGGRTRASGRGDLDVAFAGRALSPGALVAVLDGSGHLTLEDARIDALAPDAVSAAVERLLTERTDVASDAFSAAMAGAVGQGRLDIGSRKLDVEVVDGALRIARIDVPAAAGKTALTVTIDIATLAVDASADISAVGGEAAKGRPWPPVNVTFVGPIKAIGALVPTVTSDALEREVTVRKLERNVEELERLRRLDEEAAARERERLRAIDEARRQTEAEAAAAAAAAGGNAGTGSANPEGAGSVGLPAGANAGAGVPQQPPAGWTAVPNAQPSPASVNPGGPQPATTPRPSGQAPVRVSPRPQRPPRPEESQAERLQRQLLNQQ
ncbi:MAG: AsmA family protein [Hyphomicrobiaceae bacterium]|nr:AsmA family protein [Hyphomicrobiaceae bacterium]